VGSIPWSPLARGLVCRPYAATSNRSDKDAWTSLYIEESKPIIDACETIAKARGVSMAQVALAWILSKDQVSAPIVGTTSVDNLKELIGESLWWMTYRYELC
jgi:aryl-alcohol dehydrogenase-like predicted oxidoreductase